MSLPNQNGGHAMSNDGMPLNQQELGAPPSPSLGAASVAWRPNGRPPLVGRALGSGRPSPSLGIMSLPYQNGGHAMSNDGMPLNQQEIRGTDSNSLLRLYDLANRVLHTP